MRRQKAESRKQKQKAEDFHLPIVIFQVSLLLTDEYSRLQMTNER